MTPSLHSGHGPWHAFPSAGLDISDVSTARPAAPPRRAGTRLLDLLLSWQERSGQRHALLHLSDRELRDVGITRVDAGNEARKPFWRA